MAGFEGLSWSAAPKWLGALAWEAEAGTGSPLAKTLAIPVKPPSCDCFWGARLRSMFDAAAKHLCEMLADRPCEAHRYSIADLGVLGNLAIPEPQCRVPCAP